MPNSATLFTERLILRQPEPDEAAVVIEYYQRNRRHLESWEPLRDASFYTDAHWRPRLAADQQELRDDVSARFFVFERGAPWRAIGACNLNNIVRGAFEACYLGYSVDGECQGKGFGKEAVAAVVEYAFKSLGLHRVMANYQPDNTRSARLLASLGFQVEGQAADYLMLGGRWRDHVLTALVVKDWQQPG